MPIQRLPAATRKPRGSITEAGVVQEALRPYAIADKLRTLRLRRSMGLAQLAEHTGFSTAMLSHLENGRLVPTLPTLTRIALVFSVGLDYFFSDPRKRHVVDIESPNGFFYLLRLSNEQAQQLGWCP